MGRLDAYPGPCKRCGREVIRTDAAHRLSKGCAICKREQPKKVKDREYFRVTRAKAAAMAWLGPGLVKVGAAAGGVPGAQVSAEWARAHGSLHVLRPFADHWVAVWPCPAGDGIWACAWINHKPGVPVLFTHGPEGPGRLTWIRATAEARAYLYWRTARDAPVFSFAAWLEMRGVR